jgi:RNA polymerase sigma-70 factor, ECF subfamily
MTADESRSSDADSDLLRRFQAGENAAWGELLMRHQERLRRMIRLRMDPRVAARVDTADVMQESFLQATLRRDEFFRKSQLPFFVWLRLLTVQKLAEMHRHHLGVQSRDAARDVSLFARPSWNDSVELAELVSANLTSPSEHASRQELVLLLQSLLAGLDPNDQEIIALRNFEQLSNAEAAHVLGIGESACSSRYVRALSRLTKSLQGKMDSEHRTAEENE